MEQVFEEACKEHIIPGAVLLAANGSGTFKYENVFGSRSLKDISAKNPLKKDDIMWTASCTKLMTSIAALQLVERGSLSLDEDVASILPELTNLDILTGFEDDRPQLTKASDKITLRLLLTHSSGFCYDSLSPLLQQWRRSRGERLHSGTTTLERYMMPLVHEPGTAWAYSPGLDFVGLMIERASGSTLGEYMAKNIWQVLKINDMTFHLKQREDLRQRLVDMSIRDRSSPRAVYTPDDGLGSEDYISDSGGAGVYSSAPDYFKVVLAVLQNDERLLKKATVDEMFKPQLSEQSLASLTETLAKPEFGAPLGGLPAQVKKNHSLAGMLPMDDLPGSWRKGTLTWGGMPNLTWFVDRESDLCGLYATQILPSGEPKSLEMRDVFQKAMYEKLHNRTAKM
ncbi:MAG: hypothetical protein LQ338_007962 [Usnochroma carphineum]|nr:MAG: hypothetical protein LQ338_007962 [Usnochroma carphineum]